MVPTEFSKNKPCVQKQKSCTDKNLKSKVILMAIHLEDVVRLLAAVIKGVNQVLNHTL